MTDDGKNDRPNLARMPDMKVVTPAGPADVTVDDPGDPAFLLVMTHGSNGGLDAPDLLAVRAEALRLGGAVAGVMQPFRVAGRRAPGAAAGQDEAWLTVVALLRERFGDLPLIQCGRSNGARVACRTALKAGARGVIALAFPLRPPWNPARSRVDELRGAGVEVLVVNGDRDPFGVPDQGDATCVHVMPGERHDLARTPFAVGTVAAEWLGRWSGQS
jgi:predicted alpha/beta-hydrolase family hydrolase